MKPASPADAMRPILLFAFSLAAAGPAFAQSDEEDEPGRREAALVVYGDDPCPVASGGEIVVCARRPEDDRYRIPEALRRGSRPAELGGVSRVEALEEAQRETRPGSCSVVGAFGHTGCTQQMIQQWYADRRARQSRR